MSLRSIPDGVADTTSMGSLLLRSGSFRGRHMLEAAAQPSQGPSLKKKKTHVTKTTIQVFQLHLNAIVLHRKVNKSSQE